VNGSGTKDLYSKMKELDEIISTVASSKKYRALCSDTIRRIAERELVHQTSLKAAVKATKKRLHQVYGAFEYDLDYEEALQHLAAAYQTGSEAKIKGACQQILESHSSTRERLPILDDFYPAIFQLTGQPAAILDMGCGLNPLAWPWMGLPSPIRYFALDIDAARIDFLNRYLDLAGLEPLARCQDILAQPPVDDADLAVLLKMSPTLERQEAGATSRLISQLQTAHVVISYAVRSLGGREKGMVEQYQQQFQAMAQSQGWHVEQLLFDTELVFVVRR
jgi:16S rRNA (guanine(1405)-N(7))-methyltransferase